MSRQNKVNPGMYTQRGRLAQDDIARELTRQRASIGSPDTWQPEPRLAFEKTTPKAETTAEPAEPAKTAAKKRPVRVKAKAAKAKPKSKAKTATRTVMAKRPVRRQTKTRKAKQ